ncbi:MAG: sulfite exporter TauE/SafE family protein [Peptococcia bacterium]|jgi:uncharacterized membrane protein YfcA
MLIYLIGLGMGILSGLAIGGGTLLVPALVFFMHVPQQTAQGICLASFIPTALVAVLTHLRQKNVDLKLAFSLTIGAIVGALVGSTLANHVDAALLRKIFGAFLFGMGVYEVLSSLQKRVRP